MYTDSGNRCVNVNCIKDTECVTDSKCWNVTYCGGPTCNSTETYKFYDVAQDTILETAATGLCGGFDCINDDGCYYGCKNASDCFFYWQTCNNSYLVTVYDDVLKER